MKEKNEPPLITDTEVQKIVRECLRVVHNHQAATIFQSLAIIFAIYTDTFVKQANSINKTENLDQIVLSDFLIYYEFAYDELKKNPKSFFITNPEEIKSWH